MTYHRTLGMLIRQTLRINTTVVTYFNLTVLALERHGRVRSRLEVILPPHLIVNYSVIQPGVNYFAIVIY